MSEDLDHFLVMRLTPSSRDIRFASQIADAPADCVARYPEDPKNDFSGFVDMLRVGDGDMVGVRYYFFEGFGDFSFYLDVYPGIQVSENWTDIYFTDHPNSRTATPNAEQLLGGLHFCIADSGELTISFDFSHLSTGCRLHLREAIEDGYRDLDE